MRLQARQTWALVRKDLLLTFSRKSAWSTVFRAGFIPIAIAVFLTIIFGVFWPSATYGIGNASPVRNLVDAMRVANTGTLVFLNNATSTGGDIDRVIDAVAQPVRDAGLSVTIVDSTADLRSTCRPTLQGSTPCFAGVVFHSSPSEGPGQLWNYTLRGDASFGRNNLNVENNNNDGEVHIYPLQRAIDIAITKLNSSSTPLPDTVNEYLFTSLTNKQYQDLMRLRIVQANINFASVVWILTLIGVTFQLVTLMAKERETEMSDLIECMMPNRRRWEPQAIRLVAHHIAFDIIYFPSWIIVALFLKFGYYKLSNAAIPVIAIILAGLALTSCSILGAAFFKRAQLSSIITVGVFIMLAIVAQVTSKHMSTAAVAILGVLFMPMALVNFLIVCARFEHENQKISLTRRAPGSPWDLPGIVFCVFFIVQIFVYPILAMLVERWFYGTAASRVRRNTSQPEYPIVVENCTRTYQHSWLWNKFLALFGKSTQPVHAVKDVSLKALKGQVMVLVGANGCGKTTILNGIVGLGSMTSGKISVDGSSGIGICPQKNVLWNSLTVEEHAKIFNQLKATEKSMVGADLEQLYVSCGLFEKLKTPSRNLSGGQKRKLQLLMMLTGASQICCVDEASGGLDPLSRRKIWDVLLAERGSRTVILTTHFLDEAEFLADNMVIMHHGEIKAVGSVSELKEKLGNGYRVHVVRGAGHKMIEQADEFEDMAPFSQPSEALQQIKELEAQGVTNYQIAGPTIEEVFMNMAADRDAAFEDDEPIHPAVSRSRLDERQVEKKEATDSVTSDKSAERKHVGLWKQLIILFAKRFTVFQRNPAPLLLTLIVPVAAAGLISMLLSKIDNPGCSINDQFSTEDTTVLPTDVQPQLLVGPQSALNASNIALLTNILPSGNIGSTGLGQTLLNSVRLVNSLNEFNDFTNSNYSTINPGGVYLGDTSSPPTFSVRSNIGIVAIFSGVLLQNALNVLLSGVRIATQYTVFDFAWPSATDNTIQFVFYFGLVMAAYPAFFTLYLCQERLRGIRAMEYSNGVRPLPLWSAYTLFDWGVTIFSSVIIIIIFAAATPSAWYSIGYLFVVFLLYGLAAVLLAYIIAGYSKSQFAAFALYAGGQCVMLLIYLTTFMAIEAQSKPADITSKQTIAHYIISCISPISQVLRSMLIGLNLFSFLCQGSPPSKRTDPGAWDLYGGPIFFLIIQSLLMFAFLVWRDHRFSLKALKKHRDSSIVSDAEDTKTLETEVAEEQQRVMNSDDGLKIMHVDKTYKSLGHDPVYAVDDLTFGVKRGEVFALVGPNGAGKSTTISMLRGDIKPTGHKGDLYVQGASVLKDRYEARFHLGVCPQFDAMDKMTVREHLAFYARIRGVVAIDETVQHMIRSVGLQPFADRMAEKLSGGNKRKLSLAMALIGNPEVVLLDEPSSGMDPLAKRNMWKTLARFRPGRSILLTTHSMEEADALASRVGVISRQLLDIGTTDHLRAKHGYGYHVHLVMKSAPATTIEEMQKLIDWIKSRVPGAHVVGFPYHGQMRLIVPAHQPLRTIKTADDIEQDPSSNTTSVVSLFSLLEANKYELGIAFYSVSPSTFDEIFLKIIDKHNIQEEQGQRTRRKRNVFKNIFSSK